MSRYRTLGAFLALAVAWGAAFVAISAGLDYLPPVLFAAVRYDVAGLVMLAYAAYAVDDPLPRGRDQWAVVAIGSTLLIAIYNALLFVGQQHTTAAAAAVLIGLSPVLTTGFARALAPAEALSPVGVLGVLTGLVGVGVMVRPDPSNLVTATTVGNLFVFGSAASFALGSVLTRRIDAGLRIETMEAWSMLGGAAIMHLVSLGLREPIVVADWARPEAIGAVAYLSLVAGALGFLLYFDLLERLGAVEINMVTYVSPVVAAVVGWLALGEAVDAGTVAGFGFIFAGFVLVKRRALREEFGGVRRNLPGGSR